MNKVWKYNNLLNLKESDSTMLKDLYMLANGEVAAATQYRIANSNIIKDGKEAEYLIDHFKEHAEDEWKHNEWLNTYLWKNEKDPVLSIQSSVNEALPSTEELEDVDPEYLRDFFYKAEDEAIKAYNQFLNTYDDIIDDTLKDIINDIIEDEKDHKKDFEKGK